MALLIVCNGIMSLGTIQPATKPLPSDLRQIALLHEGSRKCPQRKGAPVEPSLLIMGQHSACIALERPSRRTALARFPRLAYVTLNPTHVDTIILKLPRIGYQTDPEHEDWHGWTYVEIAFLSVLLIETGLLLRN